MKPVHTFIWLSFLLLITEATSVGQTTFVSAQTGYWDDGSTWIGGMVPGPNDHAIISDGTTVTLFMGGTGTFITNLTINPRGVLNADNKEMNVAGTLIVNGTYTSFDPAAQDLNFTGDTIGGTGNISIYKNTSYLRIYNDGMILPGSNLLINGHVHLESSVTVRNHGTVEVKGNISGEGASSVWTNESGSHLIAGNELLLNGVLNASSPDNTVKYNRLDVQTVKLPASSTYHNLVISGAGVKTMEGSLVINGDLTVGSGTLDCNSLDIEILGNWTNTSSFVEGTGTIAFTGPNSQEFTHVSGDTLYHIHVNKSGGELILNDHMLISDALSLTAGIVDTGSDTLTLGTGLSNEGTLYYTSGTIVGKFERWINATGSYLFPVGTTDHRNSILFGLAGFDTGGSIVAEFLPADPGNSGLPVVDGAVTVYNTFVDGYWDLSAMKGFSLGTNSYNLELEGNGFSAFPIDTETRIVARSGEAGNWIANGLHGPASGTTAKRSGLTFLSAQFTFGDDTNCSKPVTSPITGPDEVCTGETGVIYQVTDHPPNTYTWIITGGVQVSGGNTHSITVDWGVDGMADANVRVIEYNSCTNAAPVDFPVTIHSIPPSSISGKKAVAEYTNGVPYSVTDMTDYTFDWTITGGIQASGGTTNSITVDWGGNGTGIVEVVARKNGCDPAPAVMLEVNKYVIIESVTSGDWSDPGTWDCNCVPLPTENVRILNGHNVTLTEGGAGSEVNNFIINAGGKLTTNNRNFTVHGDFVVDGFVEGTPNKSFTLDGIDKTIDGAGTVREGIDIPFGNKSLEPTAVVNLNSGDLVIGPNTTITNHGRMNLADSLVGSSATSKWVNDENSTLYLSGNLLVTGVLDADAIGNTVGYIGTEDQLIKIPQSGYYNLLVAWQSVKILQANTFVYGNLMQYSSCIFDVSPDNYTIYISGDWINEGSTFLERSGEVVFQGTSDQVISGEESFYDLTCNKSSGAINLQSHTIVSDSLSLVSGNIITNTYVFSLGTDVDHVGKLAHTNGWIIGKFERWINATGTPILFPLGSQNFYDPATLTFASVAGGSLIGEFNPTDPGSVGLPLSEGAVTVAAQYPDGYWDFTASNGLITTDFNIGLTANGFTSYTVLPGTRILKRTNGGSWNLDGTHASGSPPVVYRNNLAGGLSSSSTQFGLGHIECPTLDLTCAITGISCFGDADGEIDITVSGGEAPYTYNWSDLTGTGSSPTSEDQMELSVGTYQLIVSDVNGCQLDSVLTVPGPTQPLLGSIAGQTDVACYGEATGSVTVEGSGGTPPYEYCLDGGTYQGSETFNNLVADDYIITIRDTNLCTVDVPVTIVQPASAVTGSITDQTDIICYGDSAGIITVEGSEGTPPYEYSLDGGAYQGSGTFSNLVANNYLVTVRDANLCTANVPVTISQPDSALTGTIIDQTDIACYGEATGSVTIAASGGTLPYEYNLDGGPYQGSGSFSNLVADDYTITIRDANLCTADLPVTIIQPAAALTGSIVEQYNCCFGEITGMVTVEGAGGTIPYEYSLDGGPYQASGTFSNLAANSYIITIRDAGLCTTDIDVVITEASTALTGTLVSKTDITCHGDSTGSLTVTGEDGTPPYEYSIDGINFQVSGTFSSLTANTYNVIVRDANHCTFTIPVTIVQPTTPFVVTIIDQKDVTCAGYADGEATIEGEGGVEPYEYSLNGSPYQSSGTFTGLAGGDYDATILDANLCTANLVLTILEPDSIRISPTITDPTCIGEEDGSIVLNAAGGTQPCTFFWSNGETTEDLYGLEAGTYTVDILDANGCSYQGSIELVYTGVDCFSIPNAFIPNNDGINDFWEIRAIESYPNATVHVYSRSGQLVFSTKNGYTDPWDGTFKGKKLPMDTYFYIIDLKDGSEPITGQVTIIR